MTKAQIAAARLRESWQPVQDERVRVIAPLSAAQMNARIAPDQRTVGALAEHIVRGRARRVVRHPQHDYARMEEPLSGVSCICRARL